MRPLIVSIATVVVIGLSAVVAVAPNADAQDATEDRIAALETAVAGLQEIHPAPPFTSERGVRLNGSGDTVTAPIDFPGGTAVFRATCSDGYFAVTLFSFSGDALFVFSGIGPYEGSRAYPLPDREPLVIEVICRGDWTLSVIPLNR